MKHYYESLARSMHEVPTSYLGGDLQGFLWWESRDDKIASRVLETTAWTKTKAETVKLVSTVYRAYELLVKQGYAPYEFGTPNAINLSDEVSRKTSLSKSTVVPILTAVEDLAKSGKIKVEDWNPSLKGPGFIESATGTASGFWKENVQKPVAETRNMLVTAATITAIIWLVSKSYFDRRTA